MMAAETIQAIVTLAEAQAYARIESGEEEGLLAGLVRSASALCEAFLGQVVIARPFSEQLTASCEWQRLTVSPVRSIESVSINGVPAEPGTYATDLDATGCGWVRSAHPSGTETIEVSGMAGIAIEQNGVPEPIRQGVLRLVAHLFMARDGEGGEVPAAVTALWRPYRRMRLS